MKWKHTIKRLHFIKGNKAFHFICNIVRVQKWFRFFFFSQKYIILKSIASSDFKHPIQSYIFLKQVLIMFISCKMCSIAMTTIYKLMKLCLTPHQFHRESMQNSPKCKLKSISKAGCNNSSQHFSWVNYLQIHLKVR